MSKTNLAIIAAILISISIGCKSLMPTKSTEKNAGPAVDFTTPGKGLDVKVQLDKKQTSSAKIGKDGGSVSLTGSDGSKFTLDVPANALDAETEIAMTAVKSLDGAPMDNKTPTAVQLEPSGLLFKELVTLTVTPTKEISVKNQIIFSYEGEGQDYHLAVIDPKSREIRIKLMEFSGAGVGSGSDSAWAANLEIQAATASSRLSQKMAALLQAERMEQILGNEKGIDGFQERVRSLLDQFDDQVVRKQMAAAELDCRFARRALHTILSADRQRQLMGFPPPTDTMEKANKMLKLAEECKKPAAFQIVGGLDDWKTSTKVCDILQPFELTGGGFSMKLSGGLVGTYSYTGPFSARGTGKYTISLPGGLDKPGTMTGTGDGTITGDKVYSGSGTENYTLTPLEPCG